MSKQSKKKKKLSKRFKRTIGFSIAGLFLISAIIVALIPQRDVSAFTDSTADVYLEDSENSVPTILPTDVIYTTGDGLFQFAYITKNSGANKVAVICGYDFERSLPGGDLKIPDTVDAYIKLTDTDGTESGYVAVSMSNEPLYYATYKEEEYYEDVVDDNGYPVYVLDDDGNPKLDGSGNPIPQRELKTREVVDSYLPCYYKAIDTWSPEITNNEGKKERVDKDLYYKVTDSSGAVSYELTVDDLHKRMKNAQVNYIANQNVVKSGSTWVLSASDSDGIFSKAKNIVNLSFGSQLIGIGNYAFANCANLSKITFSDGLNTLGNYAFANCYNLKEVTLPYNTAISVIGEKAFYNCQGLQSFSLPVGVKKIGDSCFEGCTDMTSCVLDVPDMNMALVRIGKNVFKDCASLEELEFPRNFRNLEDETNTATQIDLDISWFSGCSSLKHLTIKNTYLTFATPSASGSYDFEDFKNETPKEFYFEGVKDEALHNTSKSNAFAFKYLNEEIYEKVIHDDGNPTNDNSKIVYQVNNNNQLIYFEMGNDVAKVDIPEKIGPYNVSIIGSDSFAGNTVLEFISIPSTITEIEANAFKGCSSLRDVIFQEPINISYIGDGAFDTQIVDASLSSSLSTNPVLTFTGNATKGSAPFDYAMNPENYINNADQNRTYITFYTGWPSNMTVKYNPDTNDSELVDFPTLNSIASIGLNTYPYMTASYATAAQEAKSRYDAGLELTDNQKAIINAAVNVTIPSGITSIKEGLISGYNKNGVSSATPRNDIETITSYGIKKFDPYSFKGLTNLKGVYINAGATSLGDYAFEGCSSLSDVDIYSDLQEFGRVPFLSCRQLTNVDFGELTQTPNPYFTCVDGIIYSKVNGNRDAILEVLASRGEPNGIGSGSINPSEFIGINTLAPEAFRDCDGILSVDFSQSGVTAIPEGCFRDCDNIYSVILKDGHKSIGPSAFENSNIRYLEIPRSTTLIDNTAFKDDDAHQITFYCEEDSPAAYYADNYPNIIVSTKPLQFHVYFYDEDTVTLLDTQIVNAGSDATTYVVPEKPGYIFDGWYPEPKNVTSDMNTYAKFVLEDPVYYTVTFLDWDDTVLDVQQVVPGGDCKEIKNPEREGFRFIGWRPAITNIQADTIVYAQYEEINPFAEFTVEFYDWDDTLLHTQKVKAGEDCVEVKDPVRAGYKFLGWKPGITNITEDRKVYAQYEKITDTGYYTVKFYDWDDTLLHTQTVKAGEDCIEVKEPVREGYKFTGWKPSIKNVTEDRVVYAQYEKLNSDDNNKDNPDNPDNPNTDPDKKDDPNTDPDKKDDPNTDPDKKPDPETISNPTLYTVTVVDGTGSGSYVQGANVIILANNPPSGKVFDKWTADEGVSLLKSDLAANYFIMPAKNVTVKATYKDDGSNKNDNNNNNNPNTNNNPTVNNPSSPHTTVTVTKPGIPNPDLASATVIGSSDNYVLKITESQSAKAEVEDALLTKYDSLDPIKFIAMDISLYDATGSAKIENASDLKVSVTLPIPEDLVPYAGNNKVACVVNGKLVDLSPKFTTINGVPCINFVCNHFSPYTIYVDTSNLTSSVNYTSTSTPKTGDGLSVKWYISIGLFAASIIFFALCIPTGKKKKVASR